MIFSTKYIKRISSALLIFYCAFLLLAIFHSHKLELSSGRYNIVAESKSSKKAVDPFLDNQANCLLVQFANTLFFNHSTLGNKVVNPNPEYLQLCAEQNLPLAKTFYSNTLRAPPSIS